MIDYIHSKLKLYYYSKSGRIETIDGHQIHGIRGTEIEMSDSSRIILNNELYLNLNAVNPHAQVTTLKLEENSRIYINGRFTFYYNSDVLLFKGATLKLGDNSSINIGCKIRCFDSITIGDGCRISHDFTAIDSDAHTYNGTKATEPIIIGDHVWIGTRVTILKGVKIGNGSIIAGGGSCCG